ncbi:DNA-binding transcriptional regulator, MurR/RpiR family, contains HTH and SIS domains [Friedmanniella luteola]|uniref:DNA-binding transcriptional regulator, MurR/RpiR family, contains HTH and SIS domains n=1 Tax=Friedmanniella luteola TaxID=546871 RepID=A0A1H1QH19_9ACTN|nr:MurR/RpiR family transcriptional regulator [Friedmanniella luteola]SDS22706.1 DNA-binding transcriptional regulator, MurR/RpiR family, contains HTH and SIS domains [Friedmanniella luteola]
MSTSESTGAAGAAPSANGTAPRPTLSILIRVRGALPNLRPAERRVAEAVLADPAKVSESSITTVARQCQTSETTVLRFCRALGLAGYPELRIALARAAQWEETDHAAGGPVTGVITKTDTLAEVVAKVTHADARSIEDTGAALDVDVLEAAVSAVAAARRVDVYGTGASALVGQDLQLKLHRIGLVSFLWSQHHQALASAALLGAGDVAIGISHTGTTAEVVDALRVARERGATTIGVTNFAGSAIAEHAALVLTTAARETTFRSGAMSSRIAQLAVVDCLFTGVAQRSYDSAVEALENTYVVVQARRSARSGAVVRPLD